MAGLSWGDVVVVVASLVGVIGMAMYSSKKGKKNAPRGNAEQFFLAGRSMPWWICAASLFASNIGGLSLRIWCSSIAHPVGLIERWNPKGLEVPLLDLIVDYVGTVA